jgi:hypothetical protein
MLILFSVLFTIPLFFIVLLGRELIVWKNLILRLMKPKKDKTIPEFKVSTFQLPLDDNFLYAKPTVFYRSNLLFKCL